MRLLSKFYLKKEFNHKFSYGKNGFGIGTDFQVHRFGHKVTRLSIHPMTQDFRKLSFHSINQIHVITYKQKEIAFISKHHFNATLPVVHQCKAELFVAFEFLLSRFSNRDPKHSTLPIFLLKKDWISKKINFLCAFLVQADMNPLFTDLELFTNHIAILITKLNNMTLWYERKDWVWRHMIRFASTK